MTGKKPDMETHPHHGGVPEPVIDESTFLTRPVDCTLLSEVAGDPKKLDQLRRLVSQHADLTPEELREEIAELYGRHVSFTETAALVEALSREPPTVIVKAENK